MSHKNHNRTYNDYSKQSTEAAKAKATDEVSNAVVQETEPEPPAIEVKAGVVVNCRELNIRKEPNTNCEILGRLKRGDCVAIYELYKGETDFYKISHGASDFAYVMAKYIELKQ